jgi:hypothetical protein
LAAEPNTPALGPVSGPKIFRFVFYPNQLRILCRPTRREQLC